MSSLAPHGKPPLRGMIPRTASGIAVTWNGEDGLKAPAEALAQELALPCTSAPDGGATFLLVVTNEHLELRDIRNSRVGPVYVDYAGLDLRPYGRNLSRRQPLSRAFGRKVHTIIDATAGYGHDSLLLALMNFRVTAIERSGIVAALARDGLRRFEADSGVSLANRLHLITGDARKILTAMPHRPDAVYLDPMFPPKRKKTAAVKKEMRVLRELVGDDPDAAELLEIARAVARERVIVKRPDDAQPLAPNLTMSFPGKLVRYDVYLTHPLT